MKIREQVFQVITDCFKLHGAETIDTPVMELTVWMNDDDPYRDLLSLFVAVGTSDGEVWRRR